MSVEDGVEIFADIGKRTIDIIPWEAMAGFGNSNFFASIIGALCGAFAGAFIAQRVLEKNKTREELIKEIQSSNAAISIASSLCNYGIELKHRHIQDLVSEFNKTKVAIEQVKAEGKEGMKFTANIHTLPVPTFPVDALSDRVFDHLSVVGRPLALVTTLISTASQLTIYIKKRNKLCAQFSTTAVSNDPKFVDQYFGFESTDGHVNSEFPDVLMGIRDGVDDLIFFSFKLGNDLSDYAATLSEDLSKINRGKRIEVIKTDWTLAEERGLIPSPEAYEGWTMGFGKGAIRQK